MIAQTRAFVKRGFGEIFALGTDVRNGIDRGAHLWYDSRRFLRPCGARQRGKNAMKKIKAALALVLLLALALAATGCGAQSLIIGSWVDDTQSLTMQLGKDGQAIVTAYNFN